MTIAVGLLAGLLLLVLGGDALVRGAVALSLRLGIPALIVSLTVVAFGTSAPELVISVQAALGGAPDIAVGNVVGSNIANVLLVLGVPALLSGLGRAEADSRKPCLIMLVASALLLILAWNGWIGRVGGIVLLLGMTAMLLDSISQARAAPPPPFSTVPAMPPRRIGLFLATGLVALPLGAHLFVGAAVEIARAFNMSETVIGLTLVALGTSLPELATTVAAALRRNADVALGNVIGSNIFNILGILGVTALVAPLPVSPHIRSFDIWVMLAAALVLVPFVFRSWRLTRGAGLVLTGGYVAYTGVLLT